MAEAQKGVVNQLLYCLNFKIREGFVLREDDGYALKKRDFLEYVNLDEIEIDGQSLLSSRIHVQMSSKVSNIRFAEPMPETIHVFDPKLAHFFCSKLLRAASKVGYLPAGKQAHGFVIKSGFYNVLSFQNKLLNVYVKCKDYNGAQKLFDEMSLTNTVSWNTLICGGFHFGGDDKINLHLGFSYFRAMLLEMEAPDHVTLSSLFHFCVKANDIDSGKQLHCFTLKSGYDSNCYVGSSAIDLYSKSGLSKDARQCFDIVGNKDLISWNVMIYCYVLSSSSKDAIEIFRLMCLDDVKEDVFTFSTLLSLCSKIKSLELGMELHCVTIKQSFDFDVLLASTLIDMYAKNDCIDDARKIFDRMACKNVVSWTAMVVGYGKNGNGKEAVRLLQRMYRENFRPDELTLASVLSSCANISGSVELIQVHSCITKLGFHGFSSIVNAMINAYSKCGFIACASLCFSLAVKRDLVTWTSIVNAYAFHGLAEEAVESFEKMISFGMRPDRVSFLGVLSACSHGGLVSKGLLYFKIMIGKYRIVPDFEHYTSLIDLIGRQAGLLNGAFRLLRSLPIEAGADTYGAFIGACKIHGNSKLAKWATKKLLALEPNKSVNYTLISNMYAAKGRWHDVAKVRKMMRNRCEHKSIGYSWIEINGEIHSFVSNNKSHSQVLEILRMLELLFGSGTISDRDRSSNDTVNLD